MLRKLLAPALVTLVFAAACKKESPSTSTTTTTAATETAAQTAALATPPPSTTTGAANAATEPSLVSFGAGARIVKAPAEYGSGWSALWMLDEKPASGWATPENDIKPQEVVIELPEKTLLTRLEFDTAAVDGEKRGAKDISVEMSDVSEKAGFQPIASVSLADKQDRQSFPVSTQVPGRWVRLVIKNNQGAADYIELMDFRGYGKQLTSTPFRNISGTYETTYGDFHVRQEGTAITGCYENDEGILNGGIEGRIMKITWREGDKTKDLDSDQGPALMVFSPDAKQMFGLWWTKGHESEAGGIWEGTRKSDDVGGCPHWLGGAEAQMAKELEDAGRTRVYGINFDTASDVIREESKPTLDKIASIMKAKSDWSLTVEGHTDAVGAEAANQSLSERRAASVKAYLVQAGIDEARLTTAGFGASRAVAPNDNEVGRAQNRRVELVRK